ncbi:SIR2 family protein [Burkholderia cenocepacia]|uniref:SIR2 family protein n=1 Tax=Burkholderia cepacia complex TaxID=87882 RepID=UPI0019045E1D|nr:MULTISPECIES: SIR2 family protein [Burkholderia cepacia complex]MBK1824564.1 SIR2 family protein [Burkholderia orbicola]MCF1370988.1 SIR2 family protein [Burkholderia cenocepacia]MCF1388467.1 SIR2 family protein [Burkholderia cenocepacia]
MTNENSSEWGFEIRVIEAPETQSFLRSILRQDTCVPFLGAGFTRGEKARSGKVPGGEEWVAVMRDQILAAPVAEKPSDDELGKFGFQDLSDIYFRENIVSLETIKGSVDSRFTKVDITDEAKRRFLSINWPYIYTLNIDDGIERAIDGVKVLPYKAFSRHSGRRYVYKLHGDAEDVLTAANREDLRVIFGKADYIKSLEKNEYFLSSLTNDFCEKNLLFIGCSLTDELDISFALASVRPGQKSAQTARIFVTSSVPDTYAEKKKLKSYGITDVVVTDYFTFYNFAASVAEREDQAPLAMESFTYSDCDDPYSNERFVSYLLQSGWKHDNNPYPVSVSRVAENVLREKLKEPLVAVWGRRFSGRTTLLYRVLSDARTRRRFFVPSQSSMSDRVFNEIFKIEDALIAIDSGAAHHDQLRVLAQRSDRLAENNTTVLLALPRVELNALGNGYAEDAVQVDSRLQHTEVNELNKLLDPLGFQRWTQGDNILDNVFTLGASSIATGILKSQSRLDQRIDLICSEGRGNHEVRVPSKLEFSLLFYLAVRQRIYSFVHRTLMKKYGLAYMVDTHIMDFARKWSPFIEFEGTDAVSRRAENSSSVLICNSYAWTQLALRRLSDRLGLAQTASFIVDLYTSVRDVDPEAFQLTLFDNLNSIYSTKKLNEKDWGARVITAVYEKLAPYCAQEPDYWLQRAKGIYYLSNDERDIRIAIEYCEKGIVENTEKTRVNAKLTKANLLGKLCDVTKFRSDEDLSKAIDAYVEAIGKRNENPAYIDELLNKNRHGKGYMYKVYREASSRIALLPKKYDIRFIEEYANR